MINSLHIADIHLESDAIDTRDTVKGIWHIIEQVPAETLDLISFDGDVFDKAMVVPASKLDVILKFVSNLIDYCVKYDILLRILEGTPSHDRKQSKLFETLAGIKGASHLVRWIPEMEVEFIDKLGITVLYIPDEINHDNAVTLEQAQYLLKKHGLTKVDCISMHGSFLYQISGILSRPHHLEQPWMDLVRFYINIGHVHGHSTYKDVILVTGSTNRTCHNEERAKGGIITTINIKTGEKSWKFIENIYATIFKTLDVRGKGIEEIGELIDALALPDGSNLRLLLNKGDDALLSFGRIRNFYSQYKVKRKIAVEEEVAKVELGALVVQTKGVSLTFDNLEEHLSGFVNDSTNEEWNNGDGMWLKRHIAEVKDGVRSR